MNNLEELLSRHTPKPKRPLPNNFTETVISELKNSPKKNWLQNVIENLHIRRISKVGITFFAGVVLVGGTAVAIALWPKPTVTPTIVKSLPSGNHIVGVDAENCQYFKDLDGTATKPTSDKLYYEVRQGSQFTDQQIIDTVQGVCEENISNNAISAIVKQLPKDMPPTQSTNAYIINAITKNSITVTMDSHYNAALYTTQPNLTYTHFSDHLLAYNENSKVSYGDFKAGDTIKMIVQDTSGKSPETQESYNPLNHPETITILAILKIPALTADPSTFYTAIGKDIVRVEPCATSPSGFCRAYEFTN
ncbi:MAG: hypothetical protein JWO96_763 [Candidatus Saccharibacteria bacterium]|nr:hypothetical protein [Candidatus Saccharibacteria bacterium]